MYKGKMYCADFEENTITIEVEGEFSVRAGDYVLLSIEEYEELSKLHQPTVMHCVCEKHDYSDILVEEIDNRCIPSCKMCLKPLRKHGA